MRQYFLSMLRSFVIQKILLLLVIFFGVQSSGEATHEWSPYFPFTQLSGDTHVVLKPSSTLGNQKFNYQINAQDIDGEASATMELSRVEGYKSADTQMTGVKSSFGSRTAPYPGHITSTIDCQSKKYVRERDFKFESAPSKLILAVASSRRIYGVCALEDVKFASIFWSGYDEKRKQLTTVRLFKTVKDPKKINEEQNSLLKTFSALFPQPGGA